MNLFSPGRKNKKIRLALAILLGWIGLSLACNYPRPVQRTPGISEQSLRQTLAAQAFSTPQETPTGQISTPAPSHVSLWGLRTATPEGQQLGSSSSPDQENNREFDYTIQPGDTLGALALRFGVSPEQIGASPPVSPEALLPAGTQLRIPNVLGQTPYPAAVLPDSEVIYSPSTVDFSVQDTISQAGGYLSTYQESVGGELLTGSEIVQRVAQQASVNPRLLLAFLQFRSNWVLGQPSDPAKLGHPIGFYVPERSGLYQELSITAQQLNIGYYGWRAGTVTTLKFQDGSQSRISPELNAGSAAVQGLFSKFYSQKPANAAWREALYGTDGFLDLYQKMYGDPWQRAASIEPLFPPDLRQPPLELPFPAGERWSFTGGPHAAWDTGTPLGALDFSPVTGEPPCSVTQSWATASASGVIVRAAQNVVVLDIDGDGNEQTGWDLVYLHIAGQDMIAPGTRVNVDDRIGHPSCERGHTTGTHVHIARKFNGEWIAAAGPLPFELSGWTVEAGGNIYAGVMKKGDQIVTANPGGSHTSIIVR